jgi:hypothetical protein
MPSEGDVISRLATEYDVSEDDDEDARIRFSWTPYWQWQVHLISKQQQQQAPTARHQLLRTLLHTAAFGYM